MSYRPVGVSSAVVLPTTVGISINAVFSLPEGRGPHLKNLMDSAGQ